MIIITDERCVGYASPGHPERPERVSKSLEKLRSQTELPLKWAAPLPVEDAVILQAHDPALLKSIKTPGKNFDSDTLAYPQIYYHACRSVGAALKGLELARQEKTSFSLIRPPGHHATKTCAMGFCFFSNAAIAALEGRKAGYKRVAIYDFDVHHGNGTEDILLNREGFAFYSIHQSPCYPGTGLKHMGNNCFNYPMAPRTERKEYTNTLAKALDDLKRFHPDLVIVSAGFDAYVRDPLASQKLEAEDYHWLGETIRNLGVPHFSLLEGGYSEQLPDLILAYVKGLAGK